MVAQALRQSEAIVEAQLRLNAERERERLEQAAASGARRRVSAPQIGSPGMHPRPAPRQQFERWEDDDLGDSDERDDDDDDDDDDDGGGDGGDE